MAGRRDVDRAAADLDAVRALGGRLLVPEDAGWPAVAFAAFARPDLQGSADWVAPLGLWVRGPGSLADQADGAHRSVAVVGSRAATGYGRWVARDWSASLAEAGLAVVSGAAFGVDGEAHRGCLAVGGSTVAVLACGVERAYPAAHARLLEAIAEQGAVVSEYPVGAVPARHRFLVRNRLIAALATGTLVVEAGVRSGAARTATAARELGRVVMAVPGPVTSALSVGSHHLARQPWAGVVGSVGDVLEDIGPAGTLEGGAAPARAAARRPVHRGRPRPRRAARIRHRDRRRPRPGVRRRPAHGARGAGRAGRRGSGRPRRGSGVVPTRLTLRPVRRTVAQRDDDDRCPTGRRGHRRGRGDA